MVRRTRSSSSKGDGKELSGGTSGTEDTGLSLSSAAPLSVLVNRTSEELLVRSSDVLGEGEQAQKARGKPKNAHSLAATPRGDVRNRSSLERKSRRKENRSARSNTDESQTTTASDEEKCGSISEESKSSMEKTPIRSRKRQHSASNQHSPARITRSMRRAGIVTPEDVVTLEVVPECSHDAGALKEQDKHEEVMEDVLNSPLKTGSDVKSSPVSKDGEDVEKFGTVRRKSISTKSNSSLLKDMCMDRSNSSADPVSVESQTSPVKLAAEERISVRGDKQIAMEFAVSCLEKTSEDDNACETPCTSIADDGDRRSSISKNEDAHITKAKHSPREAADDVSVPVPKQSLESESVEVACSEVTIDESSEILPVTKLFVNHLTEGNLPKGRGLLESKEVLKLPTVESSIKTSRESPNICFMDEATLAHETKLADAGDVIESSGHSDQIYNQLENFKQLFKRPKFFRRDCDSALSAFYHFSLGLETRADDLPSKFITNDVETVWQFISYRGKQIAKEFRKRLHFLEDDLVLQDRPVLSSEEDSDVDTNGNLNNEDRSDVEDHEADILHLNDENSKDLEHELVEMHRQEHESDGNVKPSKKYPKSAVDDDFFSLAEMNAFLDEQDRIGQNGEDILDTVDDSWTGATNYFYEDFFGEKGSAMATDYKGHQKYNNKNNKGPRIGIEEKQTKKTRSVRFAMDVMEPEEDVDEASANEDEKFGSGPVLLCDDDDSKEPETNLKRNLKRLKQTIAKLEEENLAPRSWELSGEVSAQQRAENELLEKDVQFDHGTRKAPEITELFTEKLEELIRQRIKDKAFDDVIRKKRVEERTEMYRNQAIEKQEILKTSLAEIYEKEYQKAVEDVKSPDTINEQHAAIEKQMRELFRLIDALSNFDYTPPEIRPEIRVVSNMPALRVEEVGMVASTDEQLLAPEEIKKPQKGDLKSADEFDRTDKLRQRRKKKNRQRAMVEVFGKEVLENQKKMKKRKGLSEDEVNATDKLKSSNFFTKLQETVRSEFKEKTVKKKKVKSEKLFQSSSKYIL